MPADVSRGVVWKVMCQIPLEEQEEVVTLILSSPINRESIPSNTINKKAWALEKIMEDGPKGCLQFNWNTNNTQ